VHKARTSLQRYQHHLVIGNLLSTRKWEVVFVAPGQRYRWIRVPVSRRKKSVSGLEHLVGAADRRGETKAEGVPALDTPPRGDDVPLDPGELPAGDPEMDIESLIIPAVVDLHSRHIRLSAERRRGDAQAS